MKSCRQLLLLISVLMGTMVVLTGCTYDAAIQRLSLAEQSEFYTYRHVMTPAQERAYLAKATAVERTAYLSEIGLAQRFQALDPQDRQTVLNGLPRQGMSAEALRFIWGEPYYTTGDARRYAHWYYLSSSFGRGRSNYPLGGFGNRVDVYLVAGKVVGWVDVAPSTEENQGDDVRR
jgi:hypothetical protein